MSSKEEKVRKSIIDIYLQNPSCSYAEIGRLSNTSRATARNAIIKFKEQKSLKRKPGGGRKPGFQDPEIVKKVVRSLKVNPNLSVRDLAKKFKISVFLVQKIKQKHGLRSFKAQKTANRSEIQDQRAKTRARKLHDKFLTGFKGCILMDDETIIKADFRQNPHQKFYVARTRGAVSKIFKYKKMDKFARKYMIWQGICSCGRVTKPFVTNGILNKELYIKQCIEKRLMPLYNAHNIPPLFWPDLATCHYANDTIACYDRNNISYVTKDCNPPNSPELRPVEKFWAIMKQKLIKCYKPAKNVDDFKKKWNLAVKSLGEDVVKTLMKRLKTKVRNFAKTPHEN